MKLLKKTLAYLLLITMVVSQSFLPAFATSKIKPSTMNYAMAGKIEGVVEWLGEQAIKSLEKNTTLLLENLHKNDKTGITGALLHIIYSATDMSITEILDNTKEILNYCEVISEQIDDLSKEVNKKIKKLETDIHYQNYNSKMDKIRDVKAPVDEAWKTYVAIQDELKLKDGETTVPAERLKSAQSKIETLMEEMSDWKFDEMLDTLNVNLTKGDSQASLLTERKEVLKLVYPFEHQIYSGMHNIYNYGAAIQAQLIVLYSEYANYVKDTDSKVLVKWTKKSEEVKNNIEKQAAEADLDDLDTRAVDKETGLEKTAPFTFSDGKTQEEAYFVTLNDTGNKYAILKNSKKLKDYFKVAYSTNFWSRGNTYSYSENKLIQMESYDGRYKMPMRYENLAPLSNAANENDLLNWLRTSGGLSSLGKDQKLGDAQVLFIDKHAKTFKKGPSTKTGTQYLVEARNLNAKSPTQKYLQLDYDDIYDNKDASMTFTGESTNTKYENISVLRIYEDSNSTDGMIKIVDKSNIPQRLSLIDGNVLDISDISGDMGGKTIIASGECTIVGNENSKFTNLNIELSAGAELTLDSVNISSSKNTPAINAKFGKSTLVLEGINYSVGNPDGKSDAGVRVEENADLTITGDGSLYAKGNEGGAGIENLGTLTIDETTVTAEGLMGTKYGSSTPIANYGAGIGSIIDIQSQSNNGWTTSRVTTPRKSGKLIITHSVVTALTKGVREEKEKDYSIVTSDASSSINFSTINLNGGRITPNFSISDCEFQGSVYYTVKVKTADHYPNGTDSKVYFKLIGAKGVSDSYIFSDYIEGNALQNGHYDTVTIKVDKWLGPIQGIAIKNPGSDNWTCDYVDIITIDDGYETKSKVSVKTSFENNNSYKSFYLPNTPSLAVGQVYQSDKPFELTPLKEMPTKQLAEELPKQNIASYTVNLAKPGILEKRYLEQLKNNVKDLTVSIKDSTSNYSFKFYGKNIVNTKLDVNLGIDIKPVSASVKSRFNDLHSATLLSFKNKGNLPGSSLITINTQKLDLDMSKPISLYEVVKGEPKVVISDVAKTDSGVQLALSRTGDFYLVQIYKNDVTDYSKAEHWLSLPVSGDKAVDVFYLYPTAWQKVNKDEPNICEIDNRSMLKGSASAFDRQATAFETVGNIYAPYYRQVDAAYSLSLSLKDQEKLVGGIPKADAFAAFDYYIKNYNNGRPFILAGHSQGSNVLVYLLAEYMKAHPDVQKRMVAAYVIGYSVTDEYLANNPHLKFAEGANDTGVIISYNTQAPTIEGKNPVVLPGAKVINPISWTTDETLATADQGLGSTLPNSNLKFIPVGKYADAQIDKSKGVLVCSTADVNKLSPGNAVFGKGVYHSFDYPFYFFNIRENAANRVKHFLNN